jgi:hypothetical protein
MSAFGGKADITATERNFNLQLPQKLRQLGDVRSDPSCLIAREHLAVLDPVAHWALVALVEWSVPERMVPERGPLFGLFAPLLKSMH